MNGFVQLRRDTTPKVYSAQTLKYLVDFHCIGKTNVLNLKVGCMDLALC